MARDPLRTVLAIRERAVDELQRELAACIRSEAEIAMRIAALDQAASRDRSFHQGLPEPHRFQDMFAVRRIADAVAKASAERELVDAESRSAQARSALVAARVEAEVVGAVIAERAALTATALARREQHELEEAARAGQRETI